jgi:hypothetical protein
MVSRMEHAHDHDRDPNADPPGDSDSPPAADDGRPAGISEGLRHLFPFSPADEGGVEGSQSPHFEAFLAGIASRMAPLATGTPALDGLLDGGLRPGLWVLVSVEPGLSTALLDDLVWASVDAGRHVVFYSLRTGTQTTWERLLVEFGARIGEPLDLSGLRSPNITPECIERARHLDAGMVRRLFPLLSLEGGLPGESRSLMGFLSLVEVRLEESPPAPILLVDGLPQLAVLLGLSTGRSVALFSEVDDLLRRRDSVGVMSAEAALETPLLAAATGVLEIRRDVGGARGGDGSPPHVETRISLAASRWNAACGDVGVALSLDLP